MLEYDRIDTSERVDVNKTNGLRGCIICHHWFFFEINFKFQSKVCACCHDLIQNAMIFSDVAFAIVKENNYRINFLYMSEEEAMNLLLFSADCITIDISYIINIHKYLMK